MSESSYNICYATPEFSSVIINVVADDAQVDYENGNLILFKDEKPVGEFHQWIYFLKQ